MVDNPTVAEMLQDAPIGVVDGVLPAEIVNIVDRIIAILEDDRRFLSFGRARPLWSYHPGKGIWIENAENYVRRRVSELLKVESKYRSRIANEVVTYLQDSHIGLDVVLDSVANVLVVRNGNLNLDTGVLSPEFVPDEYHTIRVDVEYDSDKSCDYLMARLREIMASEDDIKALEEVFGYCLYKGWPYDILCMFVGEGANGKSVVIDLFEKLLGSDNVSNKSLYSLATVRFATSALFGKLANIAGEISNNEIKYTDRIKDLTGGGFIDAERKHEKSFKFRNYAKMIFSSNSPPAIKDSSYGFWRRMRRFTFPNTFARDDPNTIPRDVLLEKMATDDELSGFLNRVVVGYQRLRKNGKLTGAKEPEEERVEYLRVSDPAKYFGEMLVSQDSRSLPILKGALFEVYQRWCHTENKVGLSSAQFHTRFRMAAGYVSEQHRRHAADDFGKRKQVRVYLNVFLDVDALQKAGVKMDDLDLFFDMGEQKTLDGGDL